MFSHKLPDTLVFYLRILLVLVLVVIAGVLGMWLGRWSAPDDFTLDGFPQSPHQAPGSRTETGDLAVAPGLDVPLYFHLGVLEERTWEVLEHEIALAAAAGIHQYIVPVDAPWGRDGSLENALAWLERIMAIDPRAAFLLQVNLNPPAAWLESNPNEAVLLESGPRSYPSPASDWWLLGAQESLTTTVGQLQNYDHQHRIQGVILTALENGQWQIRGGHDRSEVNQRAFQAWLQRKYGNPEILGEVWGVAVEDFLEIEIPDAQLPEEGTPVFYDLATEYANVDYLEYHASLIADAIALLASHLKDLVPRELQVFAPYGFTFEHTENSTGHLGLGLILDSNIDGFISPVSAVDRGLGGAGGMKGPLNSVQYHGKRWLLIDDTRTPVARDPLTGDIARIPGIRNEDVFNVQRRNFAMALVHGLGLAWSDPQADGWLYEEAQWELFSDMRDVYRQVHNRRLNQAQAAPDATRLHADDADAAVIGTEGDQAASATSPTSSRAYPLPDFPPDILVVVDEVSRFYQKNDALLNRYLLTDMRDNLLRSGMKTQFVLLQDILDGFAPHAPNYVFLNAFSLTESERERLHARLAADQATALWFYAPGYHLEDPEEAAMDAAHIGRTVRMQVREFSDPHPSGSRYLLPGRWIAQDVEWGTPESWSPMFYIDDPDTDTLAEYVQGGESSVAMRVLEEGWTSIYITEPVAPPELLREIFLILEQPGYFRNTGTPHFDVLHAGDDLIAVHARGTGDRSLVLPETHDITDLFDPAKGWMQRDNFVLPMRSGDTRLFQLD